MNLAFLLQQAEETVLKGIGKWLSEHGLAGVTKALENNGIAVSSAPFLTERALEDLGVPVGLRVRFLSLLPQIQALASRSDDGEKDEVGGVGAVLEAARRPEIRQLTVLFCDIVNYTGMTGALDPEELRAVQAAYQAVCKDQIQRNDGHVAQYLGDGVVAYFGWPATHEDAADAAVRAALDIVASIRAARGARRVAVRIGISTGECWIEETGMGDPSVPSGAVGQTPVISARLQSLANENGILISGDTYRLVAGRFATQSLGPQLLKGIPEPVDVYRVLRARRDANRFLALVRRASASERGRTGPGVFPATAMVGRDAELSLLEQRWRDVVHGEGQAVFISGVAGIGKSRLVFELEQRIKESAQVSFHFQCLPNASQSPLFPIAQQVARLSGLTHSQTSLQKLNRLAQFFELDPEKLAASLRVIVGLLSIDVGGIQSVNTLPVTSARQQKAQALSALIEMLMALAHRRPVLCVLEDAQWIDASTQELLNLLVTKIDQAPILLVVTHRPEYRAEGADTGGASSLALRRLNRTEAAELVKLVSVQAPLNAAEIGRIVQESDAVPLFVEELTRSAALRPDGSRVSAGPDNGRVRSTKVPDTLRDSLVARLDLAPESKQVAQQASVIGREFTLDLLRRLSGLSEDALRSAVSHLQSSDIIHPIDVAPFNRYRFKHALLRDAAYESLPKNAKRDIHARLAEALEEDNLDGAGHQPELIAHHYSCAARHERAASLWIDGAERARRAYANAEAEIQLRSALEALDALPPSDKRDEDRAKVHLLLGQCCIPLYGYSSPLTRHAYEGAKALAESLEAKRLFVPALFGLWGHHWMVARHDEALALAESLLDFAKTQSDTVGALVGHRSLGCTLFTMGEFGRARGHLEQVISWNGQSADDATFTVDPTIAARLMLSWMLWIQGYPDRALEEACKALRVAERSADPYSLAFSNYVLSAVRLLREEFAESLACADTSLAIAREHSISLYELYSRFGRGCALLGVGRIEEALIEIKAGIAGAEASGLRYMRAFMLGSLAEAHAKADEIQPAMAVIQEAYAHVGIVPGRAWEPEIIRLDGEIGLKFEPENFRRAEERFRTALAMSKELGAYALELRSALSLGHLLLRFERKSEVEPLVRSVIDRQVEDSRCPDWVRLERLLVKVVAGGDP